MSPLENLARAVAETGGLVHRCYAHMEGAIAAGKSPPDVPPPPIVLFRLLLDILEERFEDVHEADLTTAARVLDAVGTAIEEDLLFVPLDTPPCARSVPRSRRRRG